MEIGADPDVYHPLKDLLEEQQITSFDDPEANDFVKRFLHGPRKIPVYSGGLGVLAGDTLKSMADLEVPVMAVSLLYREGYFSQVVDLKVGQIDHGTYWEPENTPTLYPLHDPQDSSKPLTITVPFFNEYDQPTTAKAQVWMKLELSTDLNYFVPEFLLDYNIEGSPAWIKEAARQLYSAKSTIMKANQRRMLGSSILPLTKALGFTARTIHLNEQHGVTVSLQLILRELEKKHGPAFEQSINMDDILDAVHQVSDRLVYTIHTPVKAGHDRFPRELYSGISLKTCQDILNLLANDEESPHEYNFTAFAMRVNRAVNSVSRLHRDVTRRQFPQFADKIKAITNGVHHQTWISRRRAMTFDKQPELEQWRRNPGVFATVQPQNSTLRRGLELAWQEDNRALVAYINQMLVDHRNQMAETWIEPPNYLSHLVEDGWLEPGVFTIGFARRFSTYKRADLIFEDIPALADILLKGGWRINFVFAGKAHPEDEPGKTVLKQILSIQEELYRLSDGLARLVFIPGYDMKIAKLMVSGVHAWLNSPKRPLEASGTSGMKAAINGVPNISVMDGWWVEGYHGGKTGWKFGYEGPVEEANLSEDPDTLLYAEDSLAFYALLPDVLRMFYEQWERYLDRALMNIKCNIPIFNTHRMAAEYIEKYQLELDDDTIRRLTAFRKLYQSDIVGTNGD
jgi:starch phosphorylase